MAREITIFDDPKNIRRLLGVFFAILAILLAAEFFIHKHGYFPFEDMPFFFAAYGFVACVAVIFTAKVLRFFLSRKEDYYDPEEDTPTAE